MFEFTDQHYRFLLMADMTLLGAPQNRNEPNIKFLLDNGYIDISTGFVVVTEKGHGVLENYTEDTVS